MANTPTADRSLNTAAALFREQPPPRKRRRSTVADAINAAFTAPPPWPHEDQESLSAIEILRCIDGAIVQMNKTLVRIAAAVERLAADQGHK